MRRFYRTKTGRFISKARYYSLSKSRKRRKRLHAKKKKVKRRYRVQAHRRRRKPSRVYRRRLPSRRRPRRIVKRGRVRVQRVPVLPRRKLQRPERASGWIKAGDYRKALKKQFKFEEGRSSPLPSFIKWFHPGQKFFSAVRRIPPYKPHTLYNVFAAWFIVYNDEEDEYYLWNRKRAYRRKVVMRDIQKYLPIGGKTIFDLTDSEIAFYAAQVSKQKTQGVSWKRVLESKAGIVRDQIEHIEELETYRGGLQVKAFVGWSAYPGVKSWK